MFMVKFYHKMPSSTGCTAIVFMLFFASLYHIASYKFEEISRVLHYAPTAILCVLLFLMLEKRGFVFHKKFSQWGGDISYGLYLIHVLVISAVGRLWLAVAEDYISSKLMLCIALIGSLIAATIIYRCFEKPTMGMIRNMYKRKET